MQNDTVEYIIKGVAGEQKHLKLKFLPEFEHEGYETYEVMKSIKKVYGIYNGYIPR